MGFETTLFRHFFEIMIDKVINTPEFKTAFWEWFDTLDRCERKKFYYYRSDMAEIYFYNSIYRYGAVF